MWNQSSENMSSNLHHRLVCCIILSTVIALVIHNYIHDVIGDLERKKERKTPEAMEKWKWELPQVYMYYYIVNVSHITPVTCKFWFTLPTSLVASEINIHYFFYCFWLHVFNYVRNSNSFGVITVHCYSENAEARNISVSVFCT